MRGSDMTQGDRLCRECSVVFMAISLLVTHCSENSARPHLRSVITLDPKFLKGGAVLSLFPKPWNGVCELQPLGQILLL